MLRYYASLIAIFALLVSCGDKKNSDSSSGGSTTTGTTLAKVNGETLTLEDLLQQFPAEYRDQVRGKDLQDAIDTWVNTQLLAQEGTRKGLDKDPGVEVVMRFRKSDAIARRLLEQDITNTVTVLPAELDSAYNADKAKYRSDKEQFRASHILVASIDEAQGLYSRLNKGDDFAKLAGEYSGDKQSAPNGGDIGFFTADQIDPDFAKAIVKLKVGEYSGPVKTNYGYHLIKLTDRKPAGSDPDPVEVKNKISQELLSKKQADVFQSLMESLKKSAKIERFSPPGLDLPDVPSQG
jgi:peptidyl-prolyl cis-trans isomerase C